MQEGERPGMQASEDSDPAPWVGGWAWRGKVVPEEALEVDPKEWKGNRLEGRGNQESARSKHEPQLGQVLVVGVPMWLG